MTDSAVLRFRSIRTLGCRFTMADFRPPRRRVPHRREAPEPADLGMQVGRPICIPSINASTLPAPLGARPPEWLPARWTAFCPTDVAQNGVQPVLHRALWSILDDRQEP